MRCPQKECQKNVKFVVESKTGYRLWSCRGDSDTELRDATPTEHDAADATRAPIGTWQETRAADAFLMNAGAGPCNNSTVHYHHHSIRLCSGTYIGRQTWIQDNPTIHEHIYNGPTSD